MLAAAAALAVAGCGGGAGTPKEAVEGYLAATADADGEKACGYLTDEAQERIARGGRSCKDVLGFVSALIPKDRRDEFDDVDVTVDEDGDTATATFTQPTGPGPGGAGSTERVELKKVGDEWKISDLDPGG